MTHWSGHPKRLKRLSLTDYNGDDKSNWLEELTAEIGANLLMEFFDLQTRPSIQSLSLIQQELTYVDKENRSNAFEKAEKQAQRAFKYFMKHYKHYIKQIVVD